ASAWVSPHAIASPKISGSRIRSSEPLISTEVWSLN
ncbi:uncharacterized protein METZ01_LOCUS369546, partial [marine metagenome]